MSFIFQQIGLILGSIWAVWSWVWWIVLPIVAAIIFFEFWEHYAHHQFHHSIKWKLLEIRVPQNILKTPKAMEQIFSAAYLEGERYWMSFEIVGRGGETHFYLRVPAQFRNMMEAAIYAQYPDAEISEADDYIFQMPRNMPSEEFEIYGSEQVLGNAEYIPIRTYPSFEESVEERRIDTIAILMESMAKLKDSEQMWFQFVVKPAGDKWKKEGEEAVNRLLGIEEKKKSSSNPFAGFTLGLSLSDVVMSPFRHPNQEAGKHEEAPARSGSVTPASKEAAEGIREKIAKLGFEATVRFCYIDRKSSFARDNVSSAAAFFRQFNAPNLNYFRNDPTTTTSAAKGFFKDRKTALRKRVFYEDYTLVRPHHGNRTVLNIEELATLYHFPLGVTGTTELQKVASRKGGPPASLPLIE